jgi:hypothetical protein
VLCSEDGCMSRRNDEMVVFRSKNVGRSREGYVQIVKDSRACCLV